LLCSSGALEFDPSTRSAAALLSLTLPSLDAEMQRTGQDVAVPLELVFLVCLTPYPGSTTPPTPPTTVTTVTNVLSESRLTYPAA
jgi:hypothetical protein